MKQGGIIDRISKKLPHDVKITLGYPYTRHIFFRHIKETFGDRYRPQSAGPVPPPELITTEALMYHDDLKIQAKPERYFGSGFRDAWIILTLLKRCSFDLGSMRSVLEFGCGSARVLRHFRNIAGLRLTGTDANPNPIEWNRRNLPEIHFYVNELTPPLAFDDRSFDLIYALSVFTHIPLQWQRPWLDELQRILVPGGYLLCTVHGDDDLTFHDLSQQDREQLKRDGALMRDHGHPRISYSSHVLGSWDVFQTRDQVRAAFGTGFDILSYTSKPGVSAQDTLVLRKRG
jgi:SAM-dependent methyltransferase